MASGGGDLPGPRKLEAECVFCETYGEWTIVWYRAPGAEPGVFARCQNCGHTVEAEPPVTDQTPLY